MPSSRFHDGLRGATHLARVTIQPAALTILDQDGAVLALWPLTGIKAAPEVDPDGVTALTARDRPGVLLVDDPLTLEMLRHAGLRLPRRHGAMRWRWAGLAGGAALVSGLGVALLTILPQWLAPLIPAAWERGFAGPAEALIAGSAARCMGADGQAALIRLTERLRVAGGIGMPVALAVLDKPMVNAFTLPGGTILVMRGLIATAGDGAELAGVIAHELGHVAHRDSTAMLIRALGVSVLLHAIGLGETSTAAEGAASLLTLAHGRAAETAADDAALAMLTAAGLRADGLSRFFAHMEQGPRRNGPETPGTEAEAGGPRAPSSLNWLSTHPASAARREKTARPSAGEPPFTAAEWRAIQGMCGDAPPEPAGHGP